MIRKHIPILILKKIIFKNKIFESSNSNCALISCTRFFEIQNRNLKIDFIFPLTSFLTNQFLTDDRSSCYQNIGIGFQLTRYYWYRFLTDTNRYQKYLRIN